jgi:hypothetical protein
MNLAAPPRNPTISIVGGVKQTSGYSQRTVDREPETESSHVDWWIYSDIDVNSEVLTNFSICSFEKEGEKV